MAYYEDIEIIAGNFLKCVLCDEIFENHDRVIELHLEQRKHRENYMKRLMSQNSVIIRKEQLYCCLCDQQVNIGELIDHVRSKTHSKNLVCIKEIITNDGSFIEIPDSSEFVNCIICNSSINFIFDAIQSHIKSNKHRRARSMVLQPLNGIFSVEDNDEYLWCKMCQTYFDNHIELIFQHIEESEHAKTMIKLIQLIDGQNISIENYLQDSKQDKAFCRKCSIEVPCNVDNLQRHINGKKHEKA